MASQKLSKMDAQLSVGRRRSYHSTRRLNFAYFFLSSICLFGTDNVLLAFHVGRPSSPAPSFSLNVRRVKKGSTGVDREMLNETSGMNSYEETLRLRKKEKGFQPMSSKNTSTKLMEYNQGTMDTALCLVPPDEAWDDIQRARHFARDPSFYTWPPAIRLFHPFVDHFEITEVATIIATAIEKYELEAFDVTIDQLLILPHFEVLEHHEDSMKELPKQAKIEENSMTEEEERFQALIAAEEEKGKKKLAKRKAKEKGLKENNPNSVDHKINEAKPSSFTKDQSPQQLLKDQRNSLKEFNGPCVLCLEPDEDSKIHIQAFREILRKKLFDHYDPFSPSSTVTDAETLERGLPTNVLKQHDYKQTDTQDANKNNNSATQMRINFAPSRRRKKGGATYRPLITLGRFPTVTKAVAVAKKLQQVWEPLKFRVNDLHLVSKSDIPSQKSSKPYVENQYNMDNISRNKVVSNNDPYRFPIDQEGNPTLHNNRELALRQFHGSDGDDDTFSTTGAYGCDAMIMLKGEEWHLLKKDVNKINSNTKNDILTETQESKTQTADSFHLAEEDEERIMKLLLSPAALPGGQRTGSTTHSSIEEEEDDYLQHWLEEDDEIDDGATIIIGRTQFYMGEMRQYTGMPASSTMDGKDRALGKVSGAARRRGAVHRQGDRWREGDYGQKEKDYLP